MAKTRVHVSKSFGAFGLAVDRATMRALDKTTDRAHRAIVAATPLGDGHSGVEPGHLARTWRRTPVLPRRGKRSMFDAFVFTFDPTIVYLTFGTLGRRKKKLKQPNRRRRSAAAGNGMKPNRFVARALKREFGSIVPRIGREFRA
jgi:hypothetical protein